MTSGEFTGYRILKKEFIEEYDAEGIILKHTKSGANVVALLNEDKEKTFSISFKTPPEDDRGLSHIVEHCVLRGSRKFPCKTPLAEILKGSLNSRMLIPTTCDNTTFAVSTKSTKDLFNIAEFFMDSVLFPRFLKIPEIFDDQAWRYDIFHRDDPLVLSGTVYNEVLGDFSDRIIVGVTEIWNCLFPDTQYGNCFSGTPEGVPLSSWKDACSFHKKYYHPSNSHIFIYGRVDLESLLAFLDSEYLNEFEAVPAAGVTLFQASFRERKKIIVKYPLAKGRSERGKTDFVLSCVSGLITDSLTHTGLSVLKRILFDFEESPLKNALVKARLGGEIAGAVSNTLQPVFITALYNSDIEHLDAFTEIVASTLNDIVKQGIAMETKQLAINAEEMAMKEIGDWPQGLETVYAVMQSWQFGGDPFAYLKHNSLISRLKAESTGGYFENLIEQYLINNTHSAVMGLVPEPGLAEAQRRQLAARLADHRKSLSSQQIEELLQRRRSLAKYLESEDSPKDIEKIPHLQLQDIKLDTPLSGCRKTAAGKGLILSKVQAASGITNLSIRIDVSSVPDEDIQYAALVCDLYGRLGVEGAGGAGILKRINRFCHGFKTQILVDHTGSREHSASPGICISAKCSNSEFAGMAETLWSIARETDFSDYRQILDVVKENRSMLRHRLASRGDKTVMRRLMSQLTTKGYLVEKLTGYSYFRFLEDVENQLRTSPEKLTGKLRQVAGTILKNFSVICSVVCDRKAEEENIRILTDLVSKQAGGEFGWFRGFSSLEVADELISSPVLVNYVGLGCNPGNSGYIHSEKINVFKTILNLKYFFDTVLQDGAYGASAFTDSEGSICFVSFRDPNFEKTFDTYLNIPHYLKSFNPNRVEMIKYIIGAFRDLDAFKSPAERCRELIQNYIEYSDPGTALEAKSKILETTVEDVNSYADYLGEAIIGASRCIIGDQARLQLSSEDYRLLTLE